MRLLARSTQFFSFSLGRAWLTHQVLTCRALTRRVPSLLGLLVVCGCGLVFKPVPRQSLPEISSDWSTSASLASIPDNEFLYGDLNSLGADLTACGFLKTLPDADTPENRFRLLGDFQLEQWTSSDGRSPYEKAYESWQDQIEARRRWCDVGTYRSRPRWCDSRPPEPPIPTAELWGVKGRVDYGASPFYQYALGLFMEIPNRSDFLRLVRKEFDGFFQLPIRWLVEGAFRTGVVDIYDERNSIVEARVQEKFPGVFADTPQLYSLHRSLPLNIVSRGVPSVSKYFRQIGESADQRAFKDQALRGLIATNLRPVRLWSAPTWSRFYTETKSGVASAVRGLSSASPEEQSCATTILHRVFAQMVTLKGYERPMMEWAPGLGEWRLTRVEDLLVDREDHRIRLCARPGSFVDKTRAVFLATKDLMESGATKGLTISASPRLPEPCTLNYSYVQGDVPGSHLLRATPAEAEPVKGQGFTEFLASLTHVVMALSPGAPWWQGEGSYGLPLGEVQASTRQLEYVFGSAILPYETQALALAMLNLALPTFEKNYLVYVDEFGKEVVQPDLARGIRVSERARSRGSRGRIQTKALTAAVLTDAVFRFEDSLLRLKEWKSKAEAYVHTPGVPRTERVFYRELVSGMFGGGENLDLLTEVGEKSVREKLSGLKKALALWMATFAYLEPAGSYDCYEELGWDLGDGQIAFGRPCSVETRRIWKQTMRLIGNSTGSALYLNYGQH